MILSLAWFPSHFITKLSAQLVGGDEALVDNRHFPEEKCCKYPILGYSSGAVVPSECAKGVECTEAPIYVDSADDVPNDFFVFLMDAKNISTLKIIGSRRFEVTGTIRIAHKGSGPAVTLKNADLDERSFKNLKTITVDDPYVYCDGKNKLIDIEGDYKGNVTLRLEKVANETLAVCNKPRPVTEAAVSSTVGNPITQSATLISPIEVPLNPPSLVCQENNDNAAKKSSNNGVFLYVACVVIAFLTIICICLIILSAKLYKKRPKRGTRLASFEECCKYPMLGYLSGEALPLGCLEIYCTKAPIYVDSNNLTSGKIDYFLRIARNISTLTIIGNEHFYVSSLIRIVHKGPGPAVTLKHADLDIDSFKNLKKITVDDPYVYCDGKNKLIDIEGDYNKNYDRSAGKSCE
ncbi:unnamed protein product [Caenorhabditis auriculariae]|uniref:Receptor L-domain domain-containing protein n=1 Tax=Caenorhabditis auriculariae TaxID=2777116 RepID=A0A8S1HEE2_9PELO|nr:unnamed protein product [Caenorhabditis auriculariae]